MLLVFEKVSTISPLPLLNSNNLFYLNVIKWKSSELNTKFYLYLNFYQWSTYFTLSALNLNTAKISIFQPIYWCGHFVERTVSAEFRAVTDAATRGVLWKKVFLEISQNSQENTCARVSFLIKLQGSGLQLFKKETLAQVFSCEFCEISKNTFFKKHLWATASAIMYCRYIMMNWPFFKIILLK